MRGAEPDPRAVARALLRWYARDGRDLPWRRNPDPYRALVSEVMLQQTTVETVIPRFERLVAVYPDFASLAAAPEEDLLRLWSGLGYYRRARNLRAAARAVVERHGGRLPRDLRALRRLPGVGPYPAAALAAIVHGGKVLALDGNLRRVLARLVAYRGDPRSTQGEAALRRAGDRIIAEGADPSALNQALMDVGASICSPRAPRCGACPVRSQCDARRAGLAEEIPRPRPRRAAIEVTLHAWVVRRGERILVRRRRGRLMEGMWDFPMFEAERAGPVLGPALPSARRRGRIRHAITHHRLRIEIFEARAIPAARRRLVEAGARRGRKGPSPIAGAIEPGDLRWVRASSVGSLPLTGIALKILGALDGRGAGRGAGAATRATRRGSGTTASGS